MRGLSAVDGWVVAAIFAKAAGYASALLAMGGVIFLAVFRETPPVVRRHVVQLAVSAAVIGIVLAGLRLGITAARMSGAGLAGAFDPMMLGFAWQSPLGTSSLLLLIGFAGIAMLPIGNAAGAFAAMIGALVVAASYAFVGHALGEPRWMLSALLIGHLLAASFWIGALVPLWQVADDGPSAAPLLHRFGRLAAWTVPALVLLGVVYALYLSGSPFSLLGTAYGALLLAKVIAVGVLLGLAALNKLRLVPALESNLPSASASIRRSIAAEGLLVVAVLLTTAALTTITVPPVNLGDVRHQAAGQEPGSA